MASNLLFNSSGQQQIPSSNGGFTTSLSNKPFSQPWQPKNKQVVAPPKEESEEEVIESKVETPVESDVDDKSQSIK